MFGHVDVMMFLLLMVVVDYYTCYSQYSVTFIIAFRANILTLNLFSYLVSMKFYSQGVNKDNIFKCIVRHIRCTKESNAVFQYHDVILFFAHDDVMILFDTSGQLEFDSHYTCNHSHSVHRYRLYILQLGACCDTTTTVIHLSARIVWYRPVLCGFWPWLGKGVTTERSEA